MPLRRARRTADLPGTSAVVRADRRTSAVVRRLQPGEIAVIDHLDLDRGSAEALVAAGAAAVVNAAPSSSGRYPNLGPQVLLDAGVVLVDDAGDDLLRAVRDGERLRLDDGVLLRDRGADTVPLARGRVQDAASVTSARDAARAGLRSQLQAFAATTVESFDRDRALLLDGAGAPGLRTPVAGRHALVVAPTAAAGRELAGLRDYLRRWRPVLVGVEEGADLLLGAGLRPDVVVGSLTTVSDAALRSGAELVLHVPAGTTPATERLERLGVSAAAFETATTSEGAAALLVAEGGAVLVVTAGTDATLVEQLDRGHAALASGVLVRLRLGGRLVDSSVARTLTPRRAPRWLALLLILLGVVAVVAAVLVTPAGADLLPAVQDAWDRLVDAARGALDRG